MDVQQGEVSFSSLFAEGASLRYPKMYDSGGELFQELLEIKGSSVSGILDLSEKSENKLVFGVKTKSAGGHENVSNIGSSLSGVSVKGEESVKFGDVFG